MNFNGSPKPTLGVEIELQLLDPTSLDLSASAEALLNKCHRDGIQRVKAEIHQSMVEIDTPISADVKGVRQSLSSTFQAVNQVAGELNIQVGLAGTHPFQRWSERLISNQPRYHNLYDKYQWLVRRMNVYGLHVHVGVKDGETALAVINALVRYLPHLLALSANSPFWQGVDTGMLSSRINIMESFPLAGLPPQFQSWSEFEHYCDTLKHAGVITSLKDLYWFIRPNLNFGTVEFRICDAMSTLDEAMALVALIQCMVVYASETLDSKEWQWTKEQHWVAPENQWTAARDGLQGFITTPEGTKRLISDGILELIEKLKPTALKLNCIEELMSLNKILDEGNGAQRQRAVFNNSESMREVVQLSLQEFSDLAIV